MMPRWLDLVIRLQARWVRHWSALLFISGLLSESGAAQSASHRLVRDVIIGIAALDIDQARLMRVAPSGEIVVLDGRRRLHFFDPTGKRLRISGRAGAGPGEFNDVHQAGFAAGQWWFYDANLARFSYFDGAGAFRRTVPFRDMQGPAARHVVVSPIGVFGDGETSVIAMGSTLGGERPFFSRSVATGRETMLATLPPPPRHISIRVGEMTTYFAIPFQHRPSWDVSPQGGHIALVTDTVDRGGRTTYKVTLVSCRGDTLFSRDYGYVGQPVSDSAVQAELNATLRGLSGTVREEGIKAIRGLDRSAIPSVQQPVQEVIVGFDTTIWLRHPSTPTGRPWTVLDRRGNVVATLFTPRNISIKEASLRTVWGFEEDDDGFNNIVRLRVMPAAKSRPE